MVISSGYPLFPALSMVVVMALRSPASRRSEGMTTSAEGRVPFCSGRNELFVSRVRDQE
jgi:hypothetical protein